MNWLGNRLGNLSVITIEEGFLGFYHISIGFMQRNALKNPMKYVNDIDITEFVEKNLFRMF